MTGFNRIVKTALAVAIMALAVFVILLLVVMLNGCAVPGIDNHKSLFSAPVPATQREPERGGNE